MGCIGVKTTDHTDIVSKSKSRKPSSEKLFDEIQSEQIIIDDSPTRKKNKQKDPVANPRIKFTSFHKVLQNSTVIEREQTLEEQEEILQSLTGHFIFNSLPKENLQTLVTEFKLYSFDSGKTVYLQGSIGNNFYVVASGMVEVIIFEKSICKIGKQGNFGELALLHDSPSTSTIKTIEKSLLWGLSRERFQQAVKSVSMAKYEENKVFIESIAFLSVLTKFQKNSLVSLLESHEYSKGQIIISEGDQGDIMYFIKQGKVTCIKNDQEIRKLSAGTFFGEQSFLYHSNRTATIIAFTKVVLLSIKSSDLITVLGDNLEKIIYKNSQIISLEKSEVFKQLSKLQIEKCARSMRIRHFLDSEIVIKKKPCRRIITFVLKGSIICNGIEVGVFGCVGDFDIYNKKKSIFEADWVASSDTVVGCLSKKRIEKVIGVSLDKAIENNRISSIMQKVEIFRTLPDGKLEQLVSALEVCEFPDGALIFSQGDIGEYFYIVKQGRVEVLKDSVSIRIVNQYDFFGERSIIFNEPRTATVVSLCCICWVLRKSDFAKIIGNSITQQFMKRIHLQDDSVLLNDLAITRLLGHGMFGNVFLAINPSSNNIYALKTVHRSKVLQNGISKSLCLERHILMQLDHPFIVKLVKTFKDSERVYFLMEYVQGQDLFDVIREIIEMTDENSKFFLGCLLLILEYLHERNIIYRDLKPENVMIDEDGYTKLIDFGTSKILFNHRTYTLIGTPHYMAPEIIKGTGYGVEADWWSLGVILFEFLYITLPYGDSDSDPHKIYEKILNNQIEITSASVSQTAQSLISKLLNVNPAMRGPLDLIKSNPWFNGVDWEKLITKQVSPPFIPSVPNLRKELESQKFNKLDYRSFIKNFEDTRILNNNINFFDLSSEWDKDF